jgi:hypothetical protein
MNRLLTKLSVTHWRHPSIAQFPQKKHVNVALTGPKILRNFPSSCQCLRLRRLLKRRGNFATEFLVAIQIRIDDFDITRVNFIVFKCVTPLSRSRWPRCLRHELSLLALTLGLWVPFPLVTRISAFALFVLFCVGSGLATGWSPGKVVLPTVYRVKKMKNGQGLQRLQSYRYIG